MHDKYSISVQYRRHNWGKYPASLKYKVFFSLKFRNLAPGSEYQSHYQTTQGIRNCDL